MSNLKKIEEQLVKAPNLKSMLQLDFVQERFVANYQAITGRNDGPARFQSEMFAFLEIIHDKPDLAKADRFSLFAGIIKAGTTGLSFRDNKLYVMPGKNNTVKVQSSPAGKREMLERMPEIKQCPEPQLVVKGDKFIVNKLNGVILTHESTEKSVEAKTLDDIVASYQRIIWTDGHINDVIVLHQDLIKARAKSPAQSEQSFWATYPGEAAKKVATNRSYRLYHKYPDGLITFGKDQDKEEEDTQDVVHEDIPYSQTETVNHETGEVKEQMPAADMVEQEAKPLVGKQKEADDFLK